MNGFCKILGAFFGAQPASDCPSDGYYAIEVYPDGNPIEHGHFSTEEEAEERAGRIHAERLARINPIDRYIDAAQPLRASPDVPDR